MSEILNEENNNDKIEDDNSSKNTAKKPKSKVREALELCIPVVAAIVFSIVLKMFIIANIIVPTGSMLNTIEEGDRIIASRVSYVSSDPERYDVVIFRFPDNEDILYVKRVIGLPGETVEIINGVVYVTNAEGETIITDDSFVTVEEPIGDFGPYEVPEDCYFMLGDNRNQSADSRFWNNTYVHKDKIVGKAMFKYYPGIEKID